METPKEKQKRKERDHKRYAALTPEAKEQRWSCQRQHHRIRHYTLKQRERKKNYDHQRYMRLNNIKHTSSWWGKE